MGNKKLIIICLKYYKSKHLCDLIILTFLLIVVTFETELIVTNRIYLGADPENIDRGYSKVR